MEGNHVEDKIHRILVNEFVSLITRKESGKKSFQVEIEKPYNFYGSRGFMDVYFSFSVWTSEYDSKLVHNVFEIKPFLLNFGEAIRQLKTAGLIVVANRFSDQCNLRLICPNTSENMVVLKESWSSLSAVNANLEILIVDLDKLKELNNEKEIESDSAIVTLDTKEVNESNFGKFEKQVRDTLGLISNQEARQRYKSN